MYEFKLPDLGEGIHEGEILKWYVNEGDTIGEDAALVDVETDKAAVTIPAPRAGRVVRLAGPVGATVLVGQVLAVIDTGSGAVDGQVLGAAPAAPGVAPAQASPTFPAALGSPSDPPSTRLLPVPAAPATRRLARELGLDLRAIPPSGPGGRVTPADVRRAAATPPVSVAAPPPPDPARSPSPSPSPSPARSAPQRGPVHIPFFALPPQPDFSRWGPVRREALRSIRRKTARHITTAKLVVPHVAHMDEADVTELDALRLRQRGRYAGQPGGRLSLLPFVVRAVVAGLRGAPIFNTSLDPDSEEIVFKEYFNIGVAADTPRGLVVPVLRDADRASILELSARTASLAERARDGSLSVEDLRGGTFTVSNIGALGGTGVVPAVNYPEVAILALGRAQDRAVVRDGQVVVRHMLPLTLAFDHRVADGADAARFVNALVARLEDPERLLVEA